MRIAVVCCLGLWGCTVVGGVAAFNDAAGYNARLDDVRRRKEVRVTTDDDERDCRAHRIAILQAAGRAATLMERDRILGSLKACVRRRGDEDPDAGARRSELASLVVGALGGFVFDVLILTVLAQQGAPPVH